MRCDYVVVGAGPTGATIARSLSDAGRDVVVVDRRDHVGGNVHDHAHESGIRIHTYGPHYFRTSSDRIWSWVTRFAEFERFEAEVLSEVDGEFVQWPLSARYIRELVGNWSPKENASLPKNLEQAALSIMPRRVFDLFVREYNEKQWGVSCDSLSPTLCRRFDVREDGDARLTPGAKYQGIPSRGYAELMRCMLRGIPVILGFDYLRRREEVKASRALIFTGPIDEFFGYEIGRLRYRAQARRHRYIEGASFVQPKGQVNNPTHRGGEHIRTIEWKHMMPSQYATRISGTVVTTEIPFESTHPDHHEYPFPDEKNAALYAEYRRRADALDGVVIAGRLGEYRYLDMDQAIGRALLVADRLMAL